MEVTHIPAGPEQGSFSELAHKECGHLTFQGFDPLVVPSDSSKQNILVLFTQQMINDAWAGVGQKDRKPFNILRIICALYRVPSDNSIHLMAAVTEIDQLSADAPVRFEILGKYGD
jgi:hypothetical protein